MDSTHFTTFLPEDVVFKEILVKLPIKSLMRFKCVSKSWLACISNDSTFMADHQNHHAKIEKPSDIGFGLNRYFNADQDLYDCTMFLIGRGDSIKPVEIDMSYVTDGSDKKIISNLLLGSCNGLVLVEQLHNLKRDQYDQLVLWNPATREFRNLPEPIVPTLMPASHRVEVSHGFGFDDRSNDYKIVRLEEYFYNNEEWTGLITAQLFTKNSGCWRQLEVLSGHGILSFASGRVVIDGIIHWSVLLDEKILTFDLHNEEFKAIDGPPIKMYIDYDGLFEVINWKGSLCAVMNVVDTYEFWLKTKSNDVNDSFGFCWTKTFVIEEPLVSDWFFQGVLRDEFLLFDLDRENQMLFDPVTKRTRTVLDAYRSEIVAIIVLQYAPSLISPN